MGIVISVFFRGELGRHNLPHVHVDYAEHSAVISLVDGKILAGSLPTKVYKRTLRFVLDHQAALLVAWGDAISGKTPRRVLVPKKKR